MYLGEMAVLVRRHDGMNVVKPYGARRFLAEGVRTICWVREAKLLHDIHVSRYSESATTKFRITSESCGIV